MKKEKSENVEVVLYVDNDGWHIEANEARWLMPSVDIDPVAPVFLSDEEMSDPNPRMMFSRMCRNVPDAIARTAASLRADVVKWFRLTAEAIENNVSV